MNGNSTVKDVRPATHENSPSVCPLSHIDPNKVRIVALVHTSTGRIVRRDCYAPEGDGTDIGNILRLQEGKLWLRTLDWARSKSMEAEIHLRWMPTGFTPEEIGRISVFRWPDKDPLRVFVDPS
jgi:hypothetical protein